jgi:hypothetical protein
LDGSIAVDDERVTGPTSELTWAGSSKLAKLRAHFGLPDAARKWRQLSREPGPWARVASHSKAGEPVYKLVTQVRWDKTKRVLVSITDFFCSGISGGAYWDMAPRARLESARGLLIYVPWMYTSMIPDLKGLHLTIDSWRPNRDEDGWHQTSGHFEPKIDDGVVEAVAAPVLVQAVPWLGQDLRALGELTDSAVAPCIQVCPTTMAAAGFIFGDASGMGFGRIFGALGWEGIWQLLQMGRA